MTLIILFIGVPLVVCFATLSKKVNGMFIILSLLHYLTLVYVYGNHTGPRDIQKIELDEIMALAAILASVILLLLSILRFFKTKNKPEEDLT